MSTLRTAPAVADVDLDDYRAVVRLLLVHPLVTDEHPEPGALGQVRRWEHHLRADFDELVRYRLEITPTCARLVKRPTDLDHRSPLRSHTGRVFDRRRYAYVCLVLATVLRSAAQTTVTQLADRLRRVASEVDGLGFDPDTFAHRTAFVDAVRWLESIGALRVCDGSTAAYINDPNGDALYDVDHDVAHELFQPPAILQHADSVDDLVAEAGAESRDARRRRTRQRLTRVLLERPVLAEGDLTPPERAYLHREAGSIAAEAERLTGGHVERRREGLALVDAVGDLSDRRFPGSGTRSQAALLLGERLAALTAPGEPAAGDDAPRTTVEAPTRIDEHRGVAARLDATRPRTAEHSSGDRARGEPGVGARGRDDADTPPEAPPRVPVVTEDAVAAAMDGVWRDYGHAFAQTYQDDRDRLLEEAVDELEAFDLVRRVPGGVVVMAPLARYRPAFELADTTAPRLPLDATPSPADAPGSSVDAPATSSEEDR